MMTRLYDNYFEIVPKIKNYLPQWIRDMLKELGDTLMNVANEIDIAGTLKYLNEIEIKEILI